MRIRPARVWLARVVALVVVGATIANAVIALKSSRSLFRYSRRHAEESFDVAQDRLFGKEYMESIRAVRLRFAERELIYFVDPEKADGSSYFALYALAPRRLVRFAHLGDR